MEGIEARRGSNISQGENTPEFPQFVFHDKPPPTYEESQHRQQHSTFGNEGSDVSQEDKLAIYRHPLFPLLAMLFDKCEWATSSQEGPSSHAIQSDIRSFLLHLGQDGKSLMSGNDETDSLMVKAILVLKIHLLEIEKVNELCKDFCQRYIACLKGKLQTENMLGIFSSGCDGLITGISNNSSAQLSELQGSLAYLSHSSSSNTATGSGSSSESIKTFNDQLTSALQTTQVPSLPTMVLTTNTDQNASSSIFGSLDAQYKSPVSGTPSQSLRTVPLASLSPSPPSKKSRRSILPKHATNTMKAWLFQHIAHPYPSEEEKRILAHQTDLSLLQVNNWFINARRRILQPMLESSNPENAVKPKKCNKPNQARLAQRFWPESLVQTIQSGTSSTMQFPQQQTVHIISSDLKDSVPITVVSNNQLVSTGIPIQCVQSEKMPILTMLACPTQTLNQTELVTVANNNNNVTDNVVVSLENNITDSAKSDVISEQDITTHSELQITP